MLRVSQLRLQMICQLLLLWFFTSLVLLTGPHHPDFVFLRKEVCCLFKMLMVPSVWQNFELLALFNTKDPSHTFHQPLSIKYFLVNTWFVF